MKGPRDSFAGLHRRFTRDAVRALQQREAAHVRATYTHKVLYKGRAWRSYMGSLADCQRFADEVGDCRVVAAPREEVEAEALRIERWRPYSGVCW